MGQTVPNGIDLVGALERDGYVVVPGAVAADTCAAAVDALATFTAHNRRAVGANLDERGRLYRVANLHLAVGALLALFAQNRALDVCDRFFDAPAALFTTLLFERGSEQDLHRDSPLFVTRPEGRYLGVWAALEDVDADNGPLVVVPGSHALPPIDVDAIARDVYGDPAMAPSFDDRGWDAYQGTVQDLARTAGLEPVEVHVRAGDVIVWHPLALHGGAPQRDPDRTRRSLVMHVTPLGVPVFRQDVFFDAARPVPTEPDFAYGDVAGRKYAQFPMVDFAHQYSVKVSHLHRPGEAIGDHLRVSGRRAKARFAARLRGRPSPR